MIHFGEWIQNPTVTVAKRSVLKGMIYLFTHFHTHTRTRTHGCMHARTHAHTHARTHAHTRTRTHTHTHARPHTHTHTRTHAHTHTHTHTHASFVSVITVLAVATLIILYVVGFVQTGSTR